MISVIRNHSQCMHLSLNYPVGSNWFLIAVYGNSNPAGRKRLWEKLLVFASELYGPWLVTDDFNAFLFSHEKMGGSQRGSRPCSKFQHFVTNFNLIDLGFKGPKYTWKKGLVLERLDRALCNSEWHLLFQDSVVHHMPRLYLDHRPLVIELSNKQNTQVQAKFHFQVTWVAHKDFNTFVQQTWSNSGDLESDLLAFAKKT